jgi:hypothetical protein
MNGLSSDVTQLKVGRQSLGSAALRDRLSGRLLLRGGEHARDPPRRVHRLRGLRAQVSGRRVLRAHHHRPRRRARDQHHHITTLHFLALCFF